MFLFILHLTWSDSQAEFLLHWPFNFYSFYSVFIIIKFTIDTESLYVFLQNTNDTYVKIFCSCLHFNEVKPLVTPLGIFTFDIPYV